MFDNWSDWLWTAFVSIVSVALGTIARFAHVARRQGTKFAWKRFAYEVPTIACLAVIAIPVSAYLKSTLGIEEEMLAPTCICMGYLGTRVFDFIAKFLEKRNEEDD